MIGAPLEIITAPAPPGMAPTEFRIFRRGDNADATGQHYSYNEKSDKSVIGFWRERQTKLHIDFEHMSESTDPGIAVTGAPAQGWFDIEVRVDGLWAINVEWKEPALTYLKNGQYHLFSPVFFTDDDNVVTILKSCALTNLPKMNGLTPLAAKDAAHKEHEMADGMSLEKHADCMAKHGEKMDAHAEKMSKMMEKFGDHMEKMFSKTAKAKDSDEEEEKKAKKMKDDAAAAEQLAKDNLAKETATKEIKMKMDTAKGLIDASVGKKLDVNAAKEFRMKLDKGEITPDYVEGYLAVAPELKVDPAAKPPVAVTAKWSDADIVACKQPSAVKGWSGDHVAIKTAADAETYFQKVCRLNDIDADAVNKSWAETQKRYARYQELGLFKGAANV